LKQNKISTNQDR